MSHTQKVQLEKFVVPKLVCEAMIMPMLGQKSDESEPQGKIKATATTFGPRVTEDGRKFYYTKEGFSTWADEMMQGGFQDRPLPMFINHMSENMPVGEWNEIAMDDDKMEISGQIYTNTTFGMDLLNILLRNPMMMPAVSISAYANPEGYRMVDEMGNPIDMTSEDDGYFQITSGGLREVSVVMHPANPKAEIKSVEKFLNGEVNPRYLEKLLREAELKSSDAKRVISLLKKEALLRDEELQSIETVVRDEHKAQEEQLLHALTQKRLLDRLSKWK